MTPEALPCGHSATSSLFPMRDGTMRLIVHDVEGPTAPADVWCTDGCGWVALTREQYDQLRKVGA